MDFNRRQSQFGMRSQQRGQPPSSTKHRQQQQQAVQQDPLAFLLMEPSEIVKCITEMGYGISMEDIHKPTQNQICSLFQNILEEHTGITADNSQPILDAISDRLEYSETLSDPMKMMIFFRATRNMLHECGVTDFSLGDLLKPEPQRVIKLLSYVINFSRFKTEKKQQIDEHVQRAEELKQTVDELYYRNDELQHAIDRIKKQRQMEEPQVQKLAQQVKELAPELVELNKKQQKTITECTELKEKRKALRNKIKQDKKLIEAMSQEVEKIKPYIVDSPEKLQQVNASLAASVTSNKNQIAALERRKRALDTSAESYQLVCDDLNANLSVMEQCQNDLMEEEAESSKAQRLRDTLSQKRSEAEGLEKSEQSLRQRLKTAQDRVETIQKTSAERKKARQEELKALEKKYDDLARDRDIRNDTLNQKKGKIERIQKFTQEQKDKFEDEVRETSAEYAKLEGHVKYYIAEMCKMIQVEPV